MSAPREAVLRMSLPYARMEQVINYLSTHGPADIETICKHFNWPRYYFRQVKGSDAGRLCCEDYGVVIPRPVADEYYRYKLADQYHTGAIGDGEPNIQMTLSDTMTRLATAWDQLDGLIAQMSAGVMRKQLRRVQEYVKTTLVAGNDAAVESKTGVSEYVLRVLDKIL